MPVQKKTWVDIVGHRLRIKNRLVRQSLAEFLGTFVLICFGSGAAAQRVLSREEAGNVVTANWGWGLGLCFGMHVAFGPSGAHFNPAVSLALAVVGRFPWLGVVVYTVAQMLGAFVASACIYSVYYDALNEFDGGVRQVLGENGTAAIWATYPQHYLSLLNGFWDQVFGTMMVIMCVIAIVDYRNTRPPSGMEPFVVGLLIFALSNCFSFNGGAAINPARDLAPRLFTYCVGYGEEVWLPYGIHWWWIPIVGPCIGATLGALIYIFMVEIHHPPEDDLDDDNKSSSGIQMSSTPVSNRKRVSNKTGDESNHNRQSTQNLETDDKYSYGNDSFSM